MENFRIGELFCGPGGIAVGLEIAASRLGPDRVALTHSWATDYHKATCQTYSHSILGSKPGEIHPSVVWQDIREENSIDRLSLISPIDGLCFGFPCNDYSLVGEQKGMAGEFGPLYTYGAKAIQKFQPKWFLAENVGGLSSSNNGHALVNILVDFFKLGYTIYPHLYKFEDYGVPQARHRIIIVGIRNDLNVTFRIPQPSMVTKTAAEALRGIPLWAQNQERTKQSEVVVERLKHIRPGQNAFNADLPDRLKLNVKGAKISQIYKRLDPNKPAYTVTGSGGGGTHIYHWDEPRALTNRERARLQTFPDDFVFQGTKESVRRQIGMAVPPEGIAHVFEAIFKSFLGIDYLPVNGTFDILSEETVSSGRLKRLEAEILARRSELRDGVLV